MRGKFKRTLAFTAALAMCGSMLLNFPDGMFEITLPVSAAEGDVEINVANFPDEIFRTYIDENFDTTDDDMLDADEIAAVERINFWFADITDVSDLTGVEYFTALRYLDCSDNQLESLDVSNNSVLEYLNCSGNRLTGLDLSNNTALTDLHCYSNQLTSLDVSSCTALHDLDCLGNQLTSLDVSQNTALTDLYCSGNQLTSLDVSSCTALEYLSCSANQLTSLDVSQNTALTDLDCGYNQLTSLDVSDCTALEYLYCYENRLTSLDVSNNTELTYLDCYGNALWKLDLPTDYSGSLSFDAETTIPVTDKTFDLSAYGLDGANFSDGTLDENGILTPDTIPGTVTYTVALANGSTMTVYAEFYVAINEENFPDEIFRTYVDENFDTTDDDMLDADEIAAVTRINVPSMGITDLKGVEYFTALTYLNCRSNNLTSLDVSTNTALTTLNCSENLLKSLDVSNNTALTSLDCSYNQLTSLDVSKNTVLSTLLCYGNQLTSLDLTKNTQLRYLYCSENPLLAVNAVTGITSYYNASPLTAFTANTPIIRLADYGIVEENISDFTGGSVVDGAIVPTAIPGTVTYTYDVDGEEGEHTINCTIKFYVAINEENFPDEIFRTYVSDNFDTNDDNILDAEEIAAVKTIDVYYDMSTSMNISDLTGVEYFTALTYLDCSYNNLTSLDVSKNTALTELRCYSNQLTSLKVSNNTALTTLICFSNQLTSLDVSNNLALTYLDCDSNQLPSLDVSKNTALTELLCSNNQLTSLDVSKNTALTGLRCSNNQLTSLGVTKNTELTYLNCHHNQLTSLDVSNNTVLIDLNCESNPLLSLNGVSSSVTSFISSSISSFVTTDGSVSLSDYNITEANISDLTGGEIVDGAIVPTAIPGTVTYTYDADGENGDKTISCTIKFCVAINEENFPDETFRTYVNDTFDTTDDDILTVEEAAAVTYISVPNMDISDLTGVEYFTALTYLNCYSNQLTSLDVSKNAALTELLCDSNQLESLDVSNCEALINLNCSSNQLTGITLDNNKMLGILRCYENQLISLDVSNNTTLTYLDCRSNNLTSLDVSQNTALTDLYCEINKLTELVLDNNKMLETLYCSDNSLKSLDVSNNTALTELRCFSNQLTSLDVSNNTALTYLSCYSNQLTSLDVSNNTALTDLYCHYNKLESLDVSKNIKLTYLDCDGNQLTSLDVSNNTMLETLYCYNNSYDIDLVGGIFDLSALPEGFDIDKASDWTNATVDGNTLTISDPTVDITYTYDLGNGSTEIFTLNPVSCTITEDMVSEIADQIYTGEEIEPVKIICGDYTLVEGVDYTASYENNVNTGTASVVITAAGDFYKGEVSVEFTIAPMDIANAEIVLNNDLFVYNGEEQTAEITSVTVNGLTLTADDYTITGNTGTDAGTYTLTITGNGNFTGEATADWTIGVVEIDAENFPDEIFRNYVDENFDDGDGILTADEIAAVTMINVSSMGISDLTGVEYFTALTELSCSYNQLTSLDVSKNTALEILYCEQNELTALDISNNVELEKVFAQYNQLTSLNVSANTLLNDLRCYGNQLTTLDVSKNEKLTYLDCETNQLTELVLDNNKMLETLYCADNPLKSLDVSKNTELTELRCFSNQLTSLDVSNNTALTELYCYSNQLTELVLDNNKMLETLHCSTNQLTSLDVSGCTALTTLYCECNQLTSLDVTGNTALTTLSVSNNEYGIDLTGNTFDLTTLPEGFDVTKASNWTNATVEGNILTVSDPTMTVTYTYDLGNGSTEIFTLTPVSCELTADMIQPIGNQTYTGEPIRPVVLKCGDYTLVEDTDYIIGYALCVEAGTSSVIITAIGDFWKGELTTEFTIDPMDISDAEIVLENDLFVYNREEQNAEIASVTVNGLTLTADDYEITGNTGTDAGSYTLTITGKGNFTGTATADWTIAKAIPEITLPTASALTYGQTLSESILSDDAWKWLDGSVVPTVSNDGYRAELIITDTENYDYSGVEGYGVVENIHIVTRIIPVTVTKADPIVTPLLIGTEFFEGDDLPEITLSEGDTLGWIEWTVDFELLEAGENVLEWHFTPEDSENYNEATGTMIVEAQATTTTETETTTTETETTTTETETTTTETDTTETETTTTETETIATETETTTTETETTTTENETTATETETETTTTETETTATETETDTTDTETTTTENETTTSETETDTTETETTATETETDTTETEPTTSETETDTTETETETETTTTETETDTTETETTTSETESETTETETTTSETESETTETETTTVTTESTDTSETTTETTEPTTSETETTEPSEDPDLPQTGYSVIYSYIMLAAAAMVLIGIYAVAKSRESDENAE